MNKILIAIAVLCIAISSCSRTEKRPIHRKSAVLTPDKVEKIKPFQINVYLENSLSMAGYVKGPTAFKDAAYTLIGKLSLSTFCSGLNLFYINKTVDPFKPNIGHNDLSLINQLTPKTFIAKGIKGTSSDLKSVINAALNRTDNENMSVLISDFVFSPGKKQDAATYLNQQSVGIQMDIAKKLKDFDLSILVLRMESYFNGSYYNQVDHNEDINSTRPYFIWFIGNHKQMAQLIKSNIVEQIAGGYTHQLFFQNVKAPISAKYKILHSPKVGTFSLREGAQGPIYDAEASDQPKTQGQFKFAVATNLMGTLYGSNFYTEKGIVAITKGFNITPTVLPSTKSKNLEAFSHQLFISTSVPVRPGDIHVQFRIKIPAWVGQFNSDNDLKIFTDRSQLPKTFGISALMRGVYNGFYPTPEDNLLYKLKLTLK